MMILCAKCDAEDIPRDLGNKKSDNCKTRQKDEGDFQGEKSI